MARDAREGSSHRAQGVGLDRPPVRLHGRHGMLFSPVPHTHSLPTAQHGEPLEHSRIRQGFNLPCFTPDACHTRQVSSFVRTRSGIVSENEAR